MRWQAVCPSGGDSLSFPRRFAVLKPTSVGRKPERHSRPLKIRLGPAITSCAEKKPEELGDC